MKKEEGKRKKGNGLVLVGIVHSIPKKCPSADKLPLELRSGRSQTSHL